MKRIILHIGVENTATTYLQQTFANSRESLRRAGVLYPRAPGNENHFRLAALAMDDARSDELKVAAGIRTPEDAIAARAGFFEELAGEAAVSGCDTMLLSNEHCSSRLWDTKDLQRLKNLISPLAEAITIIVYLRRQDEAFLSMYSTAVKSGSTAAPTLPYESIISARFDYEKLMARWAAVFDKKDMVVRLFDTSGGANILDDFMEAAKLPVDIAWQEPTERVNSRLDARKAEYLRILNAFFPEVETDNDATRRGNLAEITAQVAGSGAPLTLPPGVAETMMERLRASNGAVAREYLGRELTGDPLFGELDFAPAAEPYRMTLEDFARMTSEVWSIKHQQSRYLRHRLREALKARSSDG